jgi:N-acetylglucosamine kinase-like BadF-type ATPase
MIPAVLAIDGGNSKTDVVLVGHDGELRAHIRGPSSSPHRLGAEGSFTLLDELIGQAMEAAGTAPSDGVAHGVAEVAAVYLAGADLPSEIDSLQRAVAARGWAPRSFVENDTFALLRAGADERDSVAVVCGAGINCVGIGADGREVRFPALGKISGDWGGGFQLGEEALWSGARAEDGRGPQTLLARLVPEFFGLPTVMAVAEALHFETLSSDRLVELAPLVLAASKEQDPVAVAIVNRLGDEIFLLATTALRRLDLLDRPSTVVLGGGILAGGDPTLLDAVTSRLTEAAPKATVRVVSERPVVGAALAGLDLVGADRAAHQRVRAALSR